MNDMIQPIVRLPMKESLTSSLLQHHNIKKALAIMMYRISGNNIIYTRSDKSVELYGWRGEVTPHVDGTGLCYFMPIVVFGEQHLVSGSERHSVTPGTIYLLDDRVEHAVESDHTAYTLSLFMGSFDSEIDRYLVAEKMNEGLQCFFDGSDIAPSVNPSHGLLVGEELVLVQGSPQVKLKR